MAVWAFCLLNFLSPSFSILSVPNVLGDGMSSPLLDVREPCLTWSSSGSSAFYAAMHDGVGERPWLPGEMTKPLEFSSSDGLQEGLINADLILNS